MRAQFAVDFRLPEGTQTSFKLEHLKHEILPARSTVIVLPTRIEIRLRKKEPGIKWTTIEAKDELAAEKAKAAQEAYIEELNGAVAVLCTVHEDEIDTRLQRMLVRIPSGSSS